MGKVRVHELARKLNMTNQEVLAKLNAKGILVRTHSSSVDEQSAMQALSQPIKGQTEAITPRTVIRRRSKDEAALSLGQEIESAVEEESFEEAKSEKKYQETEAQGEDITKPSVKGPKTEEGGHHAPSRSNVVRVIDANAIKARLASEGRSFYRRGGMQGALTQARTHTQQPQRNTSEQPPVSRFSRPREGFTPRPVVPHVIEIHKPGSTPDTQSPRPASRHAKKKQKGSTGYSKDAKDFSSGGRELWITPGKKRKSQTKEKGKNLQPTQTAAHKKVIEITDAITVNDLAHRMSIKAGQVVSKLLSMGMMVTVNEAIDFDTATIIANEFGYEIKNVAFLETDLIKEIPDDKELLRPRAPVVTIMGHVDHGKTSVLDALRKTSVVLSEAGGITQHIGAYSVVTERGLVTFLDTPGHEAFTSMRARGAEVTDIVVLVVAADDGVMPQTREAIDHAKAANVPVVVAINKMDLLDAKPERVMQQLSELGYVPEEWGGDTQFVKISAIKKTGLSDLIDALITLAEVLELSANPDKPAVGCVIEAKLDKGRGPVATVLVQSGTLRAQDHIVAGECLGRVRAMYDSNGEKVTEAGPSMPVQVLGLSLVPTSGDSVNAVLDDKTARTIASHRSQKNREQELLKTKHVSLENFLASTPEEEAKTLRLIVKADVYGSSEALSTALKNLSTKEVKVEIVHSGVGTITESNIDLAMASNAIVIGFNIKADGKAQALSQQEKIDIRYYSVIYEAIDEVRKAMAGLLAPIIEERYLGKAEVRMVIPVSKHGKIAGCYVTDGKILRSARVRLKRKEQEIFVGQISSLKRFKEDVREVSAGYECGIGLDGVSDIKENDIIECFELKEVEAKLSEAVSSNIKKSINAEATNRIAAF